MDPVESDPADVVRRWQERAWGECDLGAVDDLIAESYVRHGPSGTSVRSHAELKSDLCQYQRALGKPTITVHDRVVDGDKVWSRITMHGTHVETGVPRVVDWLQIHRIAEGRIVEAWSLYATDVDWVDGPS